jgi:3-polyprenyl-4-hydroxybenzoate decarboxylase
MPQVIDLWSYGETGFHSLASAVVQERYARECLTAAFRILGEGQLSLTKFLLLVDKRMDLTDIRAVLTYILERADFAKDLAIFSNTAMDTLDYAGPRVNHGSKGLLVGVGQPIRQLPREFTGALPPHARKAIPFSPGCLVVEGDSYEHAKELPAHLAQAASLSQWPLVVLVDNAEAATRNASAFLWTTFTRFEPAGDIHAAHAGIHRNHVAFTPPIVLDARMKPWYPAEVEPHPDTTRLVDRRWREYFPLAR